MKKRVFIILLTLMIVFIFAACKEYNTNELTARFSDFIPDSNVVATLDGSTFFWGNHSLASYDLLEEGEDTNDGYAFWNGKFYISASKSNGLFQGHTLLIYEFDLDGSNKRLVFEKEGYKTKPLSVGNGEYLYVSHYTNNVLDKSSYQIERYSVLTGEYETVASGKDCSLDDYEVVNEFPKQYSCRRESDTLAIVNKQTNMLYRVDNEKIRNSEFGEALEGKVFDFYGMQQTKDGRIYLIYRIETNANPPYPHFVCEYLLDTDEVKFSLLFFPYDIEVIDLIFLDEIYS